MASNIKGITVEIGGNTTKLGKALEDVNKKTKSLQSELRGVNTLLKTDPSNVVLLRQKQELLTQSIGETKNKLDTLKEAQAQVQAQFEKGEITEEQYRNLQREIVYTEQKLEKLNDELKDFGSVGAQQVAQMGEKVQEVGGKVEAFGKGFSVVSAGAGALLAGSIASFKELDSGYDTIITKTGATGEALEELNTVADNIFGSMPTDIDSVGIAVGEINTRFGYTGEQLETLSTQFLQFAEINGVDLNNSIGTVDKVLEQFNMDASESGNVLDLITLKAQQTGIGADTLMNSIQENGATFKDMGLNVNEAIVLLSQFEANGVNVGVAMKSLKKATQEYTKDGLSMEEALGKTIEKIKNAKTDTQALAEAQEVFGTKGANEMAKAIREGRISLEDLSASMKDYEGVVSDTYEGTLDPIDDATVAMNNLKLAGSELAGALQTAFAPMLTSIVGKLKELAQWFGNLSPTMQKTIAIALTVVTALGPVLIVIGNLITAVGTIMTFAPQLVTAFNSIKVAFAGLNAVMSANPIGAVIVAITALVGVLVYAYNHSEKFRDIVNNAFEKVKEVAGNVVDAVVGFFTKVIDFVKNNWQGILLFIVNPFASAFKLLYDNCDEFRDFVNNFTKKVKDTFTNVGNTIVNFFTQLPGKIWNTLTNVVTKLTTWGANMKAKATSIAQNVVTSTVTFFSQLPGKIWSAIVGAITKVTQWGAQMLTKAKTAMNNVVNGITTTLSKVVSNVKSVGGDLVKGIWNGINDKVDWIKKKIGGFKDQVLNALKDAFDIHSPSRLMKKEIGENIALGVIEGINSKKANAKKSAQELSELYVESAKNRLETLKKLNKLTEADEVTFWTKIKSACKKGTSAYTEATIELTKAKSTLNDSIKSLDKQYSDDVTKVKDQLIKDIQAVTDAYDKAIESRTNQIKSSLGLFDLFGGDDAIAKEDLITNLNSQVDALREWDSVLDQLGNREGMDKGLLTELENMGVKSLATLQQISAMTDEELNQYIALFNQKNAIALERAETENQALKAQSQVEIQELISEANESLNSLEETYKSNLKELGATTADTSMEIGKGIIQSMKEGIESQYASFQSYLNSLIRSINATVNNAMSIGASKVVASASVASSAVNMATIDKQLDSTFSSGTSQSSSTVLNKLEDIANKLDSKTQIVLDTGVLVGETINKIDSALASNQSLNLRGV